MAFTSIVFLAATPVISWHASFALHQSNTLLALGDSLAAGYQPTDEQQPPPIDPATGYSDLGYPGSYPADIAKARHLKLVDLGCPGETSTSMRTTPAQADCTSLYKSEFGSSSQLAAARVFLDHHQGQVAVVTLDIGANDIDHCISTSGANSSCLASADFDLERNFGVIVRTIKASLRRDDPSARLLTMNYYDPFLGFAYLPGGTRGAQLAAESLVGVDTLNAQFAASDRLLDVGVADVEGAFKINSSLPLLSYAGKELPKNVGVTCELTWMCPTDSVTKPNIHPNLAGYSTIASAFERVLGRGAPQG